MCHLLQQADTWKCDGCLASSDSTALALHCRFPGSNLSASIRERVVSGLVHVLVPSTSSEHTFSPKVEYIDSGPGTSCVDCVWYYASTTSVQAHTEYILESQKNVTGLQGSDPNICLLMQTTQKILVKLIKLSDKGSGTAWIVFKQFYWCHQRLCYRHKFLKFQQEGETDS